jgi:hypothetical protein
MLQKATDDCKKIYQAGMGNEETDTLLDSLCLNNPAVESGTCGSAIINIAAVKGKSRNADTCEAGDNIGEPISGINNCMSACESNDECTGFRFADRKGEQGLKPGTCQLSKCSAFNDGDAAGDANNGLCTTGICVQKPDISNVGLTNWDDAVRMTDFNRRLFAKKIFDLFKQQLDPEDLQINTRTLQMMLGFKFEDHVIELVMSEAEQRLTQCVDRWMDGQDALAGEDAKKDEAIEIARLQKAASVCDLKARGFFMRFPGRVDRDRSEWPRLKTENAANKAVRSIKACVDADFAGTPVDTASMNSTKADWKACVKKGFKTFVARGGLPSDFPEEKRKAAGRMASAKLARCLTGKVSNTTKNKECMRKARQLFF